MLHVYLKYGPKKEHIIRGLKRLSKPSRRIYVGAGDIPTIEGGLGVTIVSTSHGLMSGAQARKRKIGGELLCAVW